MATPRPFRQPLAILLAVLVSACGGGGGDGGTGPVVQPPSGDFAITLSPTTLSIVQGESGTVTAAVARSGNFTGAVTLSAENVPTGLTPAFAPNVVAAGATSVTLTVGVAGTVAPGSYTFLVRAQASGLSDRTGTVSLTVTAKPAVAMALSAATGSVAQGGSASLTATVTRTNFTGAVSIAVTGAPTGVTPAVSSNGDVHTITLNVGAATPVGTHPLTVTASATGVSNVSATYTLTVTAPPPASIALTATPTAVSIQAGGSGGSTTIGITRTNFTGTVVVAAQSGLPAGVTTLNAPVGPVSGNSVTVTFSATTAAPPGTYNVVLQGAGFQATAGTVTVALTVTPAASGGGSVALSAAPASMTIAPGSGTTTFLTITRTNFTGAVTLAASANQVPAITLTLTPTITTGNSATLGIAVGASATPGTYPVTVTATGAGLTPVQLTIQVTVSNTSSGGNVAWTFCALTGFPVWFAYQDGDPTSPWTQVPLGAGNRYAFNLTTRGAVAYVFQNNPDNYTLNIAYGSRDELASQGTATCPAPGSILKTVTGTVAGFASATDFATVGIGIAFAQVPPTPMQPNFTITGVPDGLRDLVATRSTFNSANVANPLLLNKIYLRRGINPPNFSSVGTVDFNGSDAFDPTSTTLTINGIAGGEQVSASNTFITNTQSFGSLGASTLASGNTLNIFTVPSSKTAAGDVQAFTVNAATISGSSVTQIRSVTTALRNPANPSVTLGSTVNTPTISTLATAPYARPRAQFARQSDYLDQWIANFTQVGSASRRAVSITMSSAYAGSGSSIDLGVPDFTTVGGWQNVWGPIAGNLVNWTVAMTGWISATGGLVDGALFRTGQRQGTFTP